MLQEKEGKKKEQQPTEEQQNGEELISFLPGKHFFSQATKAQIYPFFTLPCDNKSILVIAGSLLIFDDALVNRVSGRDNETPAEVQARYLQTLQVLETALLESCHHWNLGIPV